MALKSRGGGKGDEDDDGESPFMSLEDVMRKLKAGPMNFGVYQTGDKENPVLIAAHKRKNPTVLGRQAKKEAGTTKGAFGKLSLDSGELTFVCENDDPPASLKKKIKTMLKQAGYTKFKPRVVLPGGAELGDDDDDDDDDDNAADEILAPGGAATKTTRGGGEETDEEKEAKQREAQETLLKRTYAVEDKIIKAYLGDAAQPLYKMIERAQDLANGMKLGESSALLDETEAEFAKVSKGAGKGGEGAADEADAGGAETPEAGAGGGLMGAVGGAVKGAVGGAIGGAVKGSVSGSVSGSVKGAAKGGVDAAAQARTAADLTLRIQGLMKLVARESGRLGPLVIILNIMLKTAMALGLSLIHI